MGIAGAGLGDFVLYIFFIFIIGTLKLGILQKWYYEGYVNGMVVGLLEVWVLSRPFYAKL